MTKENPWLNGLLYTSIGLGLVGVFTLLVGERPTGQVIAGVLMLGTAALCFVAWLACEAIAWQLRQNTPAENST